MPTAQIHQTEFHTSNSKPGLARARCSCGWFTFGTLEDCQAKAAIHDVDWQPVDPSTQPAAVSR